MRAGRLRKRVRFETETLTADGAGGNSRSWPTVAVVWGDYSPERGREKMEAGRIEASNLGILNVRYSTILAALVLPSSHVIIDGVPHNIRSIINPDQRRQRLEMIVERGTAPHG